MSKSKHSVITDVFKKEADPLIATSGQIIIQITAEPGARLKKKSGITALNHTIVFSRPPSALIRYSVRDSQYCFYDYRARLASYTATYQCAKENYFII